MTRVLRVGLVGCGGIARAHLAAYRADSNVEIVSVTDISNDAVMKFADEAGARVAQSPEEMARIDKLNAVSICTPPGSHMKSALPFLKSRIPVLCEKPLEKNVKAAAQLVIAVSRYHTQFMTAYCHRFHPAIIEVRKLIDSGALGKPLLFRNIFGGHLELEGNHRADPAISGGGCLIDNGSHSVDLFRFLVGEPTSVQAFVGNVMQPVAVEDFDVIHLDMHGKAFGEITSSYSLKVCGNWVEWYGTGGTAMVSYWNDSQPDLVYKLAGESSWTPVDCSKLPDRFTAEVHHFLECIRTRRKPSISVRDGYRASMIIQAAYTSAVKGKRISIPI